MSNRKKKKPFVNQRLKTPTDIHKKINLHREHMEDSSGYEVSLDEATFDLIMAGVTVMPHLNK